MFKTLLLSCHQVNQTFLLFSKMSKLLLVILLLLKLIAIFTSTFWKKKNLNSVYSKLLNKRGKKLKKENRKEPKTKLMTNKKLLMTRKKLINMLLIARKMLKKIKLMMMLTLILPELLKTKLRTNKKELMTKKELKNARKMLLTTKSKIKKK